MKLQIRNLSDLVKPVSNLYSPALKSVFGGGDTSTFAAIIVPKGQVNLIFILVCAHLILILIIF
jgi:hypothetical protein